MLESKIHGTETHDWRSNNDPREFLTGFQKRKQEKKKAKQEKYQERLRQEKIKERAEIRAQKKQALQERLDQQKALLEGKEENM